LINLQHLKLQGVILSNNAFFILGRSTGILDDLSKIVSLIFYNKLYLRPHHRNQQMKRSTYLLTILFFLFAGIITAKDEPSENQEIDNSIIIDRISNDDLDILISSPVFSFTDSKVKIKFHNPEHTKLLLNKNKIEFIVNGESKVLDFVNGEAEFTHRFNNSKTLSLFVEDLSYTRNVTVYPLWAIIVPLVVIILYLLKRAVFKK
jgi:hypothetical protein